MFSRRTVLRLHILSVLCLALALGGWGCSESPSAAPAQSGTADGSTGEIRIAAASDLKFALAEIIETFQAEHPGIKVEATYGSSGTLFAQLSNKAPFDLYLSADIQYPRKLIEQGRGDKETEFKYALGHIVVWVPNASPLEIDKGIEVLNDPRVKKIAIANPQTAPYGRAAEAALKTLEVYDAVKPRLVLGENVMQTSQFVESGAADVGIIALSLALSAPLKAKGRYWEVPTEAYSPLEQGGVILSYSKQKVAAAKFRSYLISPKSREVLSRFGFVAPPN